MAKQVRRVIRRNEVFPSRLTECRELAIGHVDAGKPRSLRSLGQGYARVFGQELYRLAKTEAMLLLDPDDDISPLQAPETVPEALVTTDR